MFFRVPTVLLVLAILLVASSVTGVERVFSLRTSSCDWTKQPADSPFEYGLWLREQGEYYRAISAFYEAIYACDIRHGSSAASFPPRFEISRTRFLAGAYPDAIDEIRQHRSKATLYAPSYDDFEARMLLMEVRALTEMQRFDEGLQVASTQSSPAVAEERGWIKARQFRFEDASEEFTVATRQLGRGPLLVSLPEDALAGRDLPSKSPILAGIMSGIVPGSGQMANGDWGDGVTALLINAAFIVGTVAAFNDDQPEVGGVLGFVGFGFYSGNIVGAVRGANRYNRTVRDDFVDRLEERYRRQLWDY